MIQQWLFRRYEGGHPSSSRYLKYGCANHWRRSFASQPNTMLKATMLILNFVGASVHYMHCSTASVVDFVQQYCTFAAMSTKDSGQ